MFTQQIVIPPLPVSTYGYFSGGETGIGNYTINTDRITFSSATTAAHTASNLQTGTGVTPKGLSDCVTTGYIMGSHNQYCDQIAFATGIDTTSTVYLLNNNVNFSAISDGGSYGYGYLLGGVEATGTPYYSETDRLTFSNKTLAANTVSNLTTVRASGAGVSDKVNYGYVGGGNTSSSYVATSVLDRLTFSTGATASATTSLINIFQYEAGVSGVLRGYIIGGYNSSVVQKTSNIITWSSGAVTAKTVTDLPTASGETDGTSDGSSYGYVVGGDDGVSVFFDTVWQITFSTDITAAKTTAKQSVGRANMSTMSDGWVN